MLLKRLKLSNFKNYAEADVDLCHNINCFVGNNGVGKTNILDALYYLSFGKSYFNPVDSLNIRTDEDFFAIHGYYEENEENVEVSCVVKKGAPKQLKWNKNAYSKMADHIGRIPLVMICPGDHQLIIGGSDVRRKFVDGVISQTDKGYLSHLLMYNRALEQRNRLLKQFSDDRYWDADTIAIWDDQLVLHGEKIIEARREFISVFQPLFDYYYQWISNNREVVSVSLVESSKGPLAQQLVASRDRDKFAQYTTVGPHKDDIEMMFNNMSIKKFASQGQQKTCVLALKLAQVEYISKMTNKNPILLLDDIFDKLDIERVKKLVKLVTGDTFSQVFLTDTQPDRVQAILEDISAVECGFYMVDNGIIVDNGK